MSHPHIAAEFKQGENLLQKARKYMQQKKYPKAREALKNAAQKFEETKAIFKQAEACELRGQVEEIQQNYGEAAKFYHEARDLWKKSPNPGVHGHSLQNLARVALLGSQEDDALDYALKAYDHFEVVKIPIKTAEITFLIGQIYEQMEDYKSAVFNYAIAERSIEDSKFHPINCSIYENYAHTQLILGQLQDAARLYLKSLKCEHRQGNFVAILHILQHLFVIYTEMAQPFEAEKFLSDFEQIYTSAADSLSPAERKLFDFSRMQMYFEAGKMETAEDICEELITKDELAEDHKSLATNLFWMAKILLKSPDRSAPSHLEICVQYLQEAEDIAQVHHFPSLIPEIYCLYAQTEDLKANSGQADQRLIDGRKYAQNAGDVHGEATVLEQQAIKAYSLQDLERSYELFHVAHQKYEAASDLIKATDVAYNIACTAARLHQPEILLKYLRFAVDHNPKFRKIAAQDEDFRGMKGNALFQQLLENP